MNGGICFVTFLFMAMIAVFLVGSDLLSRITTCEHCKKHKGRHEPDCPEGKSGIL